MEDEFLTTETAEGDSSSVPNDAARMLALVIGDEEQDLDHLRSMLPREGFDVVAFSNTKDAVDWLQKGSMPDVAFIHTRLEGTHDLPALRWFRQHRPTVPTIALSCSFDPRVIVDAVTMGALDVLVHPFDRLGLKSLLKRCKLESISGRRRHSREITLSPNTSFVFSSDAMRAIVSQCELLARSDLPVLILGETGTGKDVLAQYIHKTSHLSSAPFLKVNCAAMPADLLESELFGYEQGAFTGATKSKPGKFELCDGGTIFLDEISEMSPALQAKLLQVLPDGTFSRLGARSTVKVKVRVIAATNIDVKSAIQERRFREDLYYRINGYSVSLPPLRERREEIPLLFRYFMQRMAEKYARRPIAMTDRLLAACMQYPWPGNLRELECFVKRFLVLGDEGAAIAELSPGEVASAVSRGAEVGVAVPAAGLKKMLSNVKGEAEAKVIVAVLQENQWKRKKTAAELKISYKALLYKMRQYHIVVPPDGPTF